MQLSSVLRINVPTYRNLTIFPCLNTFKKMSVKTRSKLAVYEYIVYMYKCIVISATGVLFI